MGVVVKQSIKGTAFSYIGAFIGFLSTFFVQTKFLKAEEIGLLRVLLEAATFLFGFAMLGISSSAFRFYPYFKAEKKTDNGFLGIMMILGTIGALIFILLFHFFKKDIIDLFIDKSPLLINFIDSVVPLTLFLLFWNLFETYCTLRLKIAFPRFIREVGVRIFVLILYLVYAFKWITLEQMVIVFVVIYGITMHITMVYAFSLSRKVGGVRPNFKSIKKPIVKDFGKYTALILIGAVGSNIISRLDIFMVGSMMGLKDAGIYSIAFFMAVVIELPARSISSISSPIVADHIKNNDWKEVKNLFINISNNQLILGGLTFLLIWINIDNIFKILPNGDVYSVGKYVVLFIALSKLVEVTLNFGHIIISYSRYYPWKLFFTLLISVVTIITNLIFIPKFGVTGAALATFITCLTTFGLQQYILFLKIRLNPFTSSTFKLLGIILLALILNAAIPFIFNPYVDICVRSGIILSLSLLGIYKMSISKSFNQVLVESINKIGLSHKEE